jgi:diaminohydroxyphosphoribosylaminopyrimidine deaminase/5-amino-6-(5-phosphoribosylamino)uracil reductase
MAAECARLNEAFNHWIVQCTPFVTVKAGMTLDGKIATAAGESRWITGEKARAYGMKLRQGVDAILVGINTVLADDPRLTVRIQKSRVQSPKSKVQSHVSRRIVLDAKGRTPLTAKVVSDEWGALTTIVVSDSAPKRRIASLAKRVNVLVAPSSDGKINLGWLLKRLGAQNVTSLLVEGGGEVNASFLLQGLAQRVMFFYAPMILGGRASRRAVAGEGARTLAESLSLTGLQWRHLGPDWLLSARVKPR